jgi:hypothetical protein
MIPELPRTIKVIGISSAMACSLWVFLHLLALSIGGTVIIQENNSLILLIEITMILFGTACFLLTCTQSEFLYAKYKQPNRQKRRRLFPTITVASIRLHEKKAGNQKYFEIAMKLDEKKEN